jgi:hypothetical protein
MEPVVLEVNKLRPEIIQLIDALDDESLLVLHRLLLRMERDRLWRELSTEVEKDPPIGKNGPSVRYYPRSAR